MTSIGKFVGVATRVTRVRLLLAGLVILLATGGYAAYGWLASPVKQRYRFVQAAPWKPTAPVVLADDEMQRRAEEVDQFIREHLDREGIEPLPPAADEVFLRRLYLDVVGRIPGYQETVAFLQSSDPHKRAQLIDKLLASEGYVSNFFNFWADLLRLKSESGHCWGGSEYAEWIKQSLRTNKPYDQFAYELLTATGYPYENGAVGYRLRDKGMLADNVSGTMQVFLGTQVQCAECHDHPFDSIERRDFVQLAAFFSQSIISRGRRPPSRAWQIEESLVSKFHGSLNAEQRRRKTGVKNALVAVLDRAKPFTFPDNYQYSDVKPGAVAEPAVFFGPPVTAGNDVSRREAFARWAVDPENPRFAKVVANRLWKKLMGTGLVEPVDDFNNGTPSHPELLEFLAQTMTDAGFDMKQFLRILLNTETYQRATLATEKPLDAPHDFSGRRLARMSAEQVWDSLVSLAVPDVDERRGFGSAIINSRQRVERLRFMRPLAFVSWLDEPLFLDEDQRRRHPAHVAPFVTPQDVSESGRDMWTWDMTGAVDPRWSDLPRTLVRASELQSPAPADHFVRAFGQSDRETIEGSSTAVSVSQALALLNGEFHQHVWQAGAVLAREVAAAGSVDQQVKVLYLAMVQRQPDREEFELAKDTIAKHGREGAKMVAWALVNSTEFLFVQ